jgi:DNA-binding transcriptional LysR family regulator
LLPEAVTRFRKRFPKARWMIYSGTSIEIKQKIISGELDYGLFYTALALHEKKALAEIEVTQLPFQVVYSPKIGHFKSVLELNQAKLTYVGAREKDYPNSVPEQWVHGRAGIKILDTIQTNAKETQKKFVLLGNGFGVFPQFMIESELKSGKLVPIRSVESKVSVRFVMRKNENMTALVKTFLEETLFPKNLEKNRTP